MCMVVCFREHAPVAILAANSKRYFWAAWTVMKDCRSQFAWQCAYSLKRARSVGLTGARRQIYYRSTWIWFPNCWCRRIGPLSWLRISSGPRHCPVDASSLVFCQHRRHTCAMKLNKIHFNSSKQRLPCCVSVHDIDECNGIHYQLYISALQEFSFAAKLA